MVDNTKFLSSSLGAASFDTREGVVLAEGGLKAATPATVTWAGLGVAAFAAGVSLGQAVD